tara:strand:+ start:120 stop:743 length:624 start_codon:yes stop_codon:yes gene_type:complete
MPRKEATDIHPALVASTIASAAKHQDYGSQIDGWESFTSEMKAFLWVRQFHGKDSGALAYIGRSQSWLTKWVRQNPYFGIAAKNVRSKSVEVDELPNDELKRVAKWHLVQMLNDPELPVEKRLAVIKQIQVLPDEAGPTRGGGRGKVRPKIRPVVSEDIKPGAVVPDRRTPSQYIEEDEEEEDVFPQGIGIDIDDTTTIVENKVQSS